MHTPGAASVVWVIVNTPGARPAPHWTKICVFPHHARVVYVGDEEPTATKPQKPVIVWPIWSQALAISPPQRPSHVRLVASRFTGAPNVEHAPASPKPSGYSAPFVGCRNCWTTVT